MYLGEEEHNTLYLLSIVEKKHGNQTHLLLYENTWWVDLASYLGEEEHGTLSIIHCKKNMEILVARS